MFAAFSLDRERFEKEAEEHDATVEDLLIAFLGAATEKFREDQGRYPEDIGFSFIWDWIAGYLFEFHILCIRLLHKDVLYLDNDVELECHFSFKVAPGTVCLW